MLKTDAVVPRNSISFSRAWRQVRRRNGSRSESSSACWLRSYLDYRAARRHPVGRVQRVRRGLCDCDVRHRFDYRVLLYAQFSILRSRAILVIASGYLFTALSSCLTSLAFPGVLAPGRRGWRLADVGGAVPLWHCGFPLFVLGLCLVEGRGSWQAVCTWAGTLQRSSRASSWTALAAAAGAFLCIRGEPHVAPDHARSGPFRPGVALSRRRADRLALYLRARRVLAATTVDPRSFLMVVLCAYLIEIPPHYYPLPARFSTGWYAVRITAFYPAVSF